MSSTQDLIDNVDRAFVVSIVNDLPDRIPDYNSLTKDQQKQMDFYINLLDKYKDHDRNSLDAIVERGLDHKVMLKIWSSFKLSEEV